MATNNIKPFATGTDANVLTDADLASRSELQTGFVPKSKADSALIGKLIQNATAGSSALGDYIVKKTQQDVSASDADLATKLESAITAHIKAEAPKQDLSGYATKSEVTEGLAGKLDTTGKAKSANTADTAGTADVANALSTSAKIPYSQITNTPSIPDISGKADKTHTHAVADVTDLQTALDGKQAKGDYATATALSTGLAGKANASHTHTIANITGLQTALDGKATTTALTDGLADKANATHTHAQSDITGLANALNGKANTKHTHAQSDITGLTDALASKADQSDVDTEFQSVNTALGTKLNKSVFEGFVDYGDLG